MALMSKKDLDNYIKAQNASLKELYNNLPFEVIYNLTKLDIFDILENRNSETELSQDENEDLAHFIYEVWLKDESNTSYSRITDIIVDKIIEDPDRTTQAAINDLKKEWNKSKYSFFNYIELF